MTKETNITKQNNNTKEAIMIKEAILQLIKKQDLTQNIALEVMDEIMQGMASPVQISAYLTALNIKGESIDEITASALSMRKHCVRLLHDMDALEIVGTGGDHSNSFNISTTSAIIVSSAGIKVAKHGNRAASSKCGAADVLEALGVNIMVPKEKSKELLEKINICFLFAQNYHITMKYVAPIRKELGIRTIFNILGPLSNPAGANMELMGVYDESLVEPLAQVMKNLGVKRGMVVYGMDKIDEISLSSKTKICEINQQEIKTYTLHPKDIGYSLCNKCDLQGGDAIQNATIIKDILEGKEKGPKREVAALNAGAALYIAGATESIESGVRLAERQIDEGLAAKQLQLFIKESNK